MKRWIACLVALSLLPLGHALALTKNAEGLYVDDSGQVIDESESEWGSHIPGYYIGEGVAYPIGDGGDSSAAPVFSDSGSGGMTVSSSDGSGSGLPDSAVINPDGSVTIESGSIQIDDGSASEGSGHLTQAEWAARMAKAQAKLGITTGIAYVDESGNQVPAQINTLGLGRSTITVNGETMLVPTSSLIWNSNAPEDKRLAVVATTKQTYATLRSKKSQKAFVMGHCDKCTVLLVIETGKTWTMVDMQGLRGYVLTSTLAFYDNQPKEYAPGIITVKGKTPRGNTVHVRSSNKSTARQIAEYPVGTKVTVFSQDEKWSEIDVEGFHCYILNEFVTLEAPLPAMPEAESAEGAEAEAPADPAAPEEVPAESPEASGADIPAESPEAPGADVPAESPEPEPRETTGGEAAPEESFGEESGSEEEAANLPESDTTDLSDLTRKIKPESETAVEPGTSADPSSPAGSADGEAPETSVFPLMPETERR